MHSLHQGISGLPSNQHLHAWWTWKGGRTKYITAEPPKGASSRIGLWVTRDPLERYVSAFHSKVKCCDVGSGSTDLSSQPCMDDKLDAKGVIGNLMRLGGNNTKLSCLSFSDYVDKLRLVHEAGVEAKLDAHLRPQQLVCGDLSEKMPTIAGSVDFISEVVRGLNGFGLAPMPQAPVVLHRRKGKFNNHFQPEEADVRALCAVAAKEYASLNMSLPNWCLENSETTRGEALPRFLNQTN